MQSHGGMRNLHRSKSEFTQMMEGSQSDAASSQSPGATNAMVLLALLLCFPFPTLLESGSSPQLGSPFSLINGFTILLNCFLPAFTTQNED